MKNFILLTLLLVGLTATNVSAAITSTFNQEDPGGTLAGYVSNTWDVDTRNEEWVSAVLLVELTDGTVY